MNYIIDFEFYSNANMIIDGAALLILLGMIIYTTLYRRRGKPEDKLYFALIVIDVAAAILNGLSYILLGAGVHFENWAFSFIYSMLFILFDIFGAVWCIYLMLRMKWDKAKIRKYAIVFSIPALILIVVTAANIFNDFIFNFWMLPGNTNLAVYNYNLLTFIPFFVYGICTFVISFRKGVRVLILFVTLFAAQLYLLDVMATNITPLILAVYLIYAHLFAMRDSFYEEVAD